MFASYPIAPHSLAVGDLFLIDDFAGAQAPLGPGMRLAGRALV